MKTWPTITGALADYVDANWLRESPLKRRLREETGKMRQAGMQISAHQGQQMALLARTIGARRAVEVGTFTGYSALCVAEALGPDGKLWCCDVSEEWTSIGKRYWKEAGLENRIELSSDKDAFGMPLGRLVHGFDQDAVAVWKDQVWPDIKGRRATWAPASVWRTRQGRG